MKKYLAICALLLTFISFAQRENTLYMLPSLAQATYVNPVALPQHKVSIGLPIPSTYFHVTNTGFTYADLVDGNKLDYNKLPEVLQNKNTLSTKASIDLFSIRIKARNHYFSFNITEHAEFNMAYPKDLLTFPIKGNAAYEGGTIDLSGLKINLSEYREYGIGYTREEKKWQFGGKVKFLFGHANVSTRNSDITIDVENETLNHYANAQMEVNYAGPVSLPLDLTDSTQEVGELNDEDIVNAVFNRKNWGLAFDLGAGYNFNDRLHFSAALLNLGFIRWTQNATNYQFKGDAAVKGVDVLPSIIEGNDIDSDSIVDQWIGDVVSEGVNKSYSTRLVYQVNLAARYKLLKTTHVYALYNVYQFRRVRTGLTLGISHDIRRAFSVAVTNTTAYRKLINIGIGFIIKPGPFQFYVVGDNLNVLLSPITPTSLNEKTFSLRVGMNLVFGRVKKEDKLQTAID